MNIKYNSTRAYFNLCRILNKFSQLELDLWNAYQILLAGKMDVSCIFKQTHPYCMQHVNNILVDALLYGNELKGDEK